MNQQKRQKYILERIKLDGELSSADVANDLSVSLMTIRRDLKMLAAQGIIELTHGGAVDKHSNMLEYPMSIKADVFVKEKKAIAEYCATLVKPTDSVYLETGSTPFFVAKELIHLTNCTFYTNSLLVINSLSKISSLNLHCFPGKYRELSKGFIGVETITYMANYHFDICFMGTDAISDSGTVSLPNEEDAYTKRETLKHAKLSVLVADSSKFNKQTLYNVGTIADFDYVVTNLDADSSTFQQLKKMNHNLISIKENIK